MFTLTLAPRALSQPHVVDAVALPGFAALPVAAQEAVLARVEASKHEQDPNEVMSLFYAYFHSTRTHVHVLPLPLPL